MIFFSGGGGGRRKVHILDVACHRSCQGAKYSFRFEILYQGWVNYPTCVRDILHVLSKLRIWCVVCTKLHYVAWYPSQLMCSTVRRSTYAGRQVIYGKFRPAEHLANNQRYRNLCYCHNARTERRVVDVSSFFFRKWVVLDKWSCVT